MRPCSAAMIAFLHGANYEAVQIDLYTFALTTGEVCPLHVRKRPANGSGCRIPDRQYQCRSRAQLCTRPAFRTVQDHDKNWH